MQQHRRDDDAAGPPGEYSRPLQAGQLTGLAFFCIGLLVLGSGVMVGLLGLSQEGGIWIIVAAVVIALLGIGVNFMGLTMLYRSLVGKKTARSQSTHSTDSSHSTEDDETGR